MRLYALLVFLLATSPLHAQGPTLRQMAVEREGNVGRFEMGCGWAGPPLGGIVRGADIALEGTVTSRRTHPTADDRDIFTEFEIATRQVLFQRRPVAAPWCSMATRSR